MTARSKSLERIQVEHQDSKHLQDLLAACTPEDRKRFPTAQRQFVAHELYNKLRTKEEDHGE